MDAKLAAEIAAAEAELKAARAELAALEAGKLPRDGKPKTAARPKRRGDRPVHKPENGMHSSIEGDGGPAPVGERVRTDMQPIVMKHVSPFDRPVNDRMPRKVSVTVYDDAKMQQGLAMTMMEREVDSLAAELPSGWTLITRPYR